MTKTESNTREKTREINPGTQGKNKVDKNSKVIYTAKAKLNKRLGTSQKVYKKPQDRFQCVGMTNLRQETLDTKTRDQNSITENSKPKTQP